MASILILTKKINRCTVTSSDLDGLGGHRTQAFTKELIDELDAKTLWDEYGIDGDILVGRRFHFRVHHLDLMTHLTSLLPIICLRPI